MVSCENLPSARREQWLWNFGDGVALQHPKPIRTDFSPYHPELVDTEIITPDADGGEDELQSGKNPHLDKEKVLLHLGMDADVVVIDPEAEYVIDPKEFVSKGKNTPFGGKKVKGKVMATVCGGKIVYEAE